MAEPTTPGAPAAQPSAPAQADNQPNPGADKAEPAAKGDAEYEAAMAPLRAERKAAEERRKAELLGEPEPKGDDKAEGEGKDGEETKPEPKLKKFKVLGREVEIDMNDEPQVHRLIQEGISATAKFTQASKIQKQTENFVSALRNPQQTFKLLEHPQILGSREAARAAAERYLYDFVKEESMPPEERERMREKSELEELRKSEQERKDAAKQEERERLKEEYRKDYTKKFMEVLGKADLPVNDWTLDRMVKYMQLAIKKGHKQIGPGDVVEFVQRDWKKVHGQLYTNKTGEQLVKLLGDDAVKAIRNHDVQQFKAGRQNPQPTRSPNGQFEPQPAPRVVYSSAEEMRDALKNRR